MSFSRIGPRKPRTLPKRCSRCARTRNVKKIEVHSGAVYMTADLCPPCAKAFVMTVTFGDDPTPEQVSRVRNLTTHTRRS